jgi:hypothetical protein
MRTGRRASTPSADDERGVAVRAGTGSKDDAGREPNAPWSDAKIGRSSVSGVPTRDALPGDGDRRADSGACICECGECSRDGVVWIWMIG